VNTGIYVHGFSPWVCYELSQSRNLRLGEEAMNNIKAFQADWKQWVACGTLPAQPLKRWVVINIYFCRCKRSISAAIKVPAGYASSVIWLVK